jgi:hypothetical protein
MQIELLILLAAQAVSSYLSTATLHAAIGNSALRFVVTAAVSDSVKLAVYTSVAVLAVRGSWLGIAAAVAGGVIGNAIAHTTRRK